MDFKQIVEKSENILRKGISVIHRDPSLGVETDLLIQQNIIDVQLKAVRRALDAFAQGFSTANLLLTSVRNVYESAIAVRNRRIDEYLDFLGCLVGTSDHRLDPIVHLRRERNKAWTFLVNENKHLRTSIDSLKNELGKKLTAINKLKNELSSSNKQIKLEFQSRQKVLSDMKNLREEMLCLQKSINSGVKNRSYVDCKRRDDMPTLEDEHANQDEKMTKSKDPIILQEEIIAGTKAYSELSAEVCTLKAMYSNSVPYKRFEALEDLVTALKRKRAQLEDCIKDLKEEKLKLAEEYDLLKDEKSVLLDKVADLESGSSIFVTQWSRCAQYLPGGEERWNRRSCGKTNGEKLELLVDELEIMVAAANYYEDNVLFC